MSLGARVLGWAAGEKLFMGACLAVVVMGWSLVQQIQANERARVEAEFAMRSLEASQAELDSVRAERLRTDSIIADSIVGLQAARDSAQSRLRYAEALVVPAQATVAAAGATVNATVDSLRISVRPDLVPVVDLLGRQVNEERRAQEVLNEIQVERIQTQADIIAQQDSIAALRVIEYDGLWMEYSQLQMTYEEALAALQAQVGRAEGNWYDRPLWVLKGAALIGVGYGMHELIAP